MVERDIQQAGTTNGRSIESALMHLRKYIEGSGFKVPLNYKDQQIAFTKFRKDLEKIVLNGLAGGDSEIPDIIVEETVLVSRNFKLYWPKDLVKKPNGEEVKLSPQESNVLYLLMSNPGRVVCFNDFRKIWYALEMSELMVNTRMAIYLLRKRLDDSGMEYIKSIHNRGYMWVGDVQDDKDHLLDAGF